MALSTLQIRKLQPGHCLVAQGFAQLALDTAKPAVRQQDRDRRSGTAHADAVQGSGQTDVSVPMGKALLQGENA